MRVACEKRVTGCVVNIAPPTHLRLAALKPCPEGANHHTIGRGTDCWYNVGCETQGVSFRVEAFREVVRMGWH